jgi:RNA polymerase sigma factor (TIGR02999 family)
MMRSTAESAYCGIAVSRSHPEARIREAFPMSERLTVLLARVKGGDRAARDALFAAAYQELRRLAHSRLYQSGRNTVLDTTAIVHESYLRLVQTGELSLEDRSAFFGYASQVMRSIIIDSVRARQTERRGGNAFRVTLSTELSGSLADGDEDIEQVHEALLELEKVEARVARVVEMRFFGGYSEQEIADALDVTVRTVQRDWEKAQVLLQALLRSR